MSLRVFQDRPPRFDLNVPLTFRTENAFESGHCVNVSASGMLAVLNEPVELFTIGEISLLVGEFYVSIKARVARTRGTDIGFAFLIGTDNDRLACQILLDFAAAQMQPAEDGRIGCA